MTPTLFDPTPLKAMGRFNHEAVCVSTHEPGIVYQTEDRGDGLIYVSYRASKVISKQGNTADFSYPRTPGF